MFSIVERATSRTLVRVLVIVMVAALLCGSFPVLLAAREVDRSPCEMPGDADGVGGYKDFEFEGPPAGTSEQPSIYPAYQRERPRTVMVFVQHVAFVLHFFLATRK